MDVTHKEHTISPSILPDVMPAIGGHGLALLANSTILHDDSAGSTLTSLRQEDAGVAVAHSAPALGMEASDGAVVNFAAARPDSSQTARLVEGVVDEQAVVGSLGVLATAYSATAGPDGHTLVAHQAVTSFPLDGAESSNLAPATAGSSGVGAVPTASGALAAYQQLGEDVTVGGGGALASTTPTASMLYPAPTTFQAGALVAPSQGRPNVDEGRPNVDEGLSRDGRDQGAASDNAFNIVSAAVTSPIGISAAGVTRILSNGSVQPPVTPSGACAQAVEEYTFLDAFSDNATGGTVEVSQFVLPTDLTFWS